MEGIIHSRGKIGQKTTPFVRLSISKKVDLQALKKPCS
jgi:hypothetical protein